MSAIRSQDVLAAFKGVGLNHVKSDLLSKCVGMSSTLHVSPAQLAESWEAFSLNANVTELTDHTFQAYRNAVAKDAETIAEGVVMPLSGLGKRQGGAVLVTPPSKRATHRAAFEVDATHEALCPTQVVTPPPTPSLPFYHERTGAGQIVLSYNPLDLPSMHVPPKTTPRCVLSYLFPTNVTKPYRHMFTTLEERAKALNDHLERLGVEMVDHFGIGRDDSDIPLEAVGVPRQETVCCVGRICNEAHEGRINQTSILLEGSLHSTGGKRVNVDLSEMKSAKTSFSLFPGQIVAIEGLNASGRKIVANRICEGVTPTPTKTSVESLMKFHCDVQDGKPLKLMSACGPFTSSDNLDYEPLVDILEVVRAEKPDVVILAGPFVDMRHPLVIRGDTTLEADDGTKMFVTYEVFFANKIAALIEELFTSEEGLSTQFVMVPSLDEAVAEWVYPQAPLTDRLPDGGKTINLPDAEGIEFGTLGLHHIEIEGRANEVDATPTRIHRVSNPCTLTINEIVVGVTATDTLFHISADETNGNLEPGSRLGRIAQHLLQQQSYYPLFPPPASDAMSTSLDLKQMDKWRMPCQPDLLIVPSKLTCFARNVLENTVVVNPGHLTRGTNGGTYALMEIHPFQQAALESAGGSEVEMKHSIPERIRVDIKRI